MQYFCPQYCIEERGMVGWGLLLVARRMCIRSSKRMLQQIHIYHAILHVRHQLQAMHQHIYQRVHHQVY